MTKWLLAALGAGALAGWAVPGIGVWAEPVARVFLKLIQSVIAPVLFTTLVAAFGRGGEMRQLGRAGLKAIGWFEFSTTAALGIGWGIVWWMRPGDGVGLTGAVRAAAEPDFGRVLEGMFPASLFDAMARGNVLQIVIFSLVFGLACAGAGRKSEAVLQFCEAGSVVAFQYTRYVMVLAPLGVAAAMAATMASSGWAAMAGLAKFVAAAWVGQSLFAALFVLAPLLLLRVPLRLFWEHAREPFLVGFGTTSSAAALPSAMEQMEKMGVPRNMVGMTLPLGLSFNLCGSTLHLAMATFFVAQAARVTLSWKEQLLILVTLKLTSKGVAGIPRANFVILSSLFPEFGLPLEGLAALLGVDALIDMVRTGVNVLANCLGPVAVARWEGWKVNGER